MDDKPKIDEVGQWSEEKLELLRQYLAAYTNILKVTQKRWCKKIHYIDAFCGGVWHLSKQGADKIPGSPILALNTVPPFDTFTFIDKDKARIKNFITPLRNVYQDKKIDINLGDCNNILKNDILPNLVRNERTERGFIFLDPYGINLLWETVDAIANTKVYDIFINFSLMGIYRQLGDEPPCPSMKEHIDKVMGTDIWFDQIYKEPQQCSLFGNNQTKERIRSNIADTLAQIYQKKLSECF